MKDENVSLRYYNTATGCRLIMFVIIMYDTKLPHVTETGPRGAITEN